MTSSMFLSYPFSTRAGMLLHKIYDAISKRASESVLGQLTAGLSTLAGVSARDEAVSRVIPKMFYS